MLHLFRGGRAPDTERVQLIILAEMFVLKTAGVDQLKEDDDADPTACAVR